MSLQLPSTFAQQTAMLQSVEHAIPDSLTPHLQNGMLHYADRSLPSSPVLDRLAKALSAAGIAPDKLDRRAENATRLAIVAELFELPISPVVEQPARRPASALPKWRLKRTMEYIEAHISEQITLAALAAAAGMSRMYFASQFRAATGSRPHNFVLHKRIERAQHLLATTSYPLVEIAFCVGFQTQAHFTTTFKKIAGTTPMKWRREQQA